MGQHHGRSRAHPARPSGLGSADADPAHGLAYKLLLTPSGTKFGKSEIGDSVWLDPARTSPYAFYQHWLNTDDRDVGTYLRWFTELSRDEIEALEAELARAPEGRAAQRALALDITARTHGAEAAARAIADSEAKFSAAPIDDPAVLASLYDSAGGFSFDPSLARPGRRGRAGRGRPVRLEGRGAADDRGRRRDGQRHAGDRPGARPAADRRGVARRPDRQASARDRAAAHLATPSGAVARRGARR